MARLIIFVLISMFSSSAIAQLKEGYYYIYEYPDGSREIYRAPQEDLTYPKPGEKAPIYKAGEIQQGRVMTAEEIEEQNNRPRLIVMYHTPIYREAEDYDVAQEAKKTNDERLGELTSELMTLNDDRKLSLGTRLKNASKRKMIESQINVEIDRIDPDGAKDRALVRKLDSIDKKVNQMQMQQRSQTFVGPKGITYCNNVGNTSYCY